MWENSYLPGVGPTPENAPMNLSRKTGAILNELEKAHIYIAQLDQRSRELEARQEELTRELAQMKAALAEPARH